MRERLPSRSRMVAVESPMVENTHSAQEKALKINLDAARYGTFAEIGAGQEVARWFFQVGKASSTVAKSISAYDKNVSDALYGTASHFVSRERLESMLDHEYTQLVGQLDTSRGERTAFFAFADTVATHGSSRSAGGHGWLGVRFQDHPRAQPSEVIIHIEMLEAFAASQQEAVGLVGVNLIYGAYALLHGSHRFHEEPHGRPGPAPRRDRPDQVLRPRVLRRGQSPDESQLVEMGHTDVAMFLANGEVVQPSEVLYNRPVLIERGSFRPVTNVTLNMLDAALAQLREDAGPASEEPSVLMEMTLNNLMSGPTIDHRDFLSRADHTGRSRQDGHDLELHAIRLRHHLLAAIHAELDRHGRRHPDAARNFRRKVLPGISRAESWRASAGSFRDRSNSSPIRQSPVEPGNSKLPQKSRWSGVATPVRLPLRKGLDRARTPVLHRSAPCQSRRRAEATSIGRHGLGELRPAGGSGGDRARQAVRDGKRCGQTVSYAAHLRSRRFTGRNRGKRRLPCPARTRRARLSRHTARNGRRPDRAHRRG